MNKQKNKISSITLVHRVSKKRQNCF